MPDIHDSVDRLPDGHRVTRLIDNRQLLLFSKYGQFYLRHILHVDLVVMLGIREFCSVSVFEDDQFCVRHILHVDRLVLVRIAEDSECVV